MAKYRMVRTDFWKDPVVSEEMTPEDKYFYLYLLTNPDTTQIGIYRITKKQMAFDLGYSIESIHSLMDRFIEHHKLIRYNPETRELALRDWGKNNLHKGGKPMMDCIFSELKEVADTSLIQYVSETISKPEIRSAYESFCEEISQKDSIQAANDPYSHQEYDTEDDTFLDRHTIRGQKENENEKENKKEKQQQEDLYPSINHHSITANHQKTDDVKEIVEFWDENGFGFSNVNGKQQLLSWLDDSSFIQPKDVILKAMSIACANNKRRLNYVVGILKNWENESLLTVEEIDLYQGKQKTELTVRQTSETVSVGREIPRGFELDLTAGENG